VQSGTRVVVAGSYFEGRAVLTCGSAPFVLLQRYDEQPGRSGRGTTVASSSMGAVLYGSSGFIVLTGDRGVLTALVLRAYCQRL
jgi:hypothetical protein